MRAKELLVVAAAYLVVYALAALVIVGFKVGDAGLAALMGALVGSQVAAFAYHRRCPEPADFAVKGTAGATLSALAVVCGLLSQALLGWLALPQVVIPIAALASFVFPWAFFGPVQKALSRDRHDTGGSE